MGKVENFCFQGKVPVSKSLLNRCLIAQSFFSELQLVGETKSEDVEHLRQCLDHLDAGELYCGDGGTTLRFLLARLSRRPGRYRITGTERLLSRPHEGLFVALNELGTRVVSREGTSLEVETSGWPENPYIEVSLQTSSQFASAILLNAWALPSSLQLKLSDQKTSFSYFQMTIELLKQMGMDIEVNGDHLLVSAHQKIKIDSVVIEPDMSSAFTIGAYAALLGKAHIIEFPSRSLQPDFCFIQAFEKMGIEVKRGKSDLTIECAAQLKPTDFDLTNNPDLAPVLSVLLAKANGESVLSGLQSLVHKESNRLFKTQELLNALEVPCEIMGDTLRVKGSAKSWEQHSFIFDPDQDHRMAMAAGLAKAAGANIEIQTPEVVNKSYPGFWQVVGL